MTAALEMAREIAKNGPIGVAQAKFAINNGMEASLGVALPLESKAYEVTIPTKDRLEARPPLPKPNPLQGGSDRRQSKEYAYSTSKSPNRFVSSSYPFTT